MGFITDAAARLKNALGDLFPEEGPSQPMEFPTKALNDLRTPLPPIAPSRSNPIVAPKPESQQPLGKITSYNYKDEELPDTLSQSMKGAWDNRLTKQGLAVSPDIEEQFKKAGIKPKDKVEIILADGTKLIRSWEDRTMQDKQAIKTFGKPLRGRFDLHVPDYKGPHEKDGLAVVGFQKIASAE